MIQPHPGFYFQLHQPHCYPQISNLFPVWSHGASSGSGHSLFLPVFIICSSRPPLQFSDLHLWFSLSLCPRWNLPTDFLNMWTGQPFCWSFLPSAPFPHVILTLHSMPIFPLLCTPAVCCVVVLIRVSHGGLYLTDCGHACY